MQFLLLCCFEEKRWNEIPEGQRGQIMKDYGDWISGLDHSGHHLSGAQLQSVSSAKTIRGNSGKSFITDGPFAETKEQLGGYHLIECRDFDEAMAIAQRIPTIPFGGAVEVRPLY
jgi:hypothetical protein